ncbi:MAG TPA: hypothetical protein VJ349_09365, partial [Stellaceae bacterium]|nr:hypothetical protein [Stellaceae bacterium]
MPPDRVPDPVLLTVLSCPFYGVGVDGPLRHRMCQGLVVGDQTMEPSEMELMRIGVDTSKHVFTLHGVDASG